MGQISNKPCQMKGARQKGLYNAWCVILNLWKRQYDFSRKDQRAGKALFPSMSVRAFLEEVSVWTGELHEAGGSPQCRRAASNPVRARGEQKGRGRGDLLSLHELRWPFSCPRTLGLLVLRLLPRSSTFSPDSQAFRLRLNSTTGLLVLQLANNRLWGLLVWASSYSKSLYIVYFCRHVPSLHL